MRRLPPALLLGLGLESSFLVASVAHQLIDNQDRGNGWTLAVAGVSFAFRVLAAYGVLELARGRGGRGAWGAKLAAIGFAIEVATTFGFNLLATHEHWMSIDVATGFDYAFCVAGIALFGGFALVAEASVPIWIGVVIVYVVTTPPPILAAPIYRALDLGSTAGLLVDGALGLLKLVTLLGLAARACRDRTTSPDPARASAGLRRASRSFWFRLIAALLIPAVALFVALAPGSDASATRLPLMAAAVVGVVALVTFAAGAIAASMATIPDLGSTALLIGGAGALWCAGVGLEQLPELYRMLYVSGDSSRFAVEAVQTFSVVVPLVGIASAISVIVAIHGFAARRTLDDLISQTSARGMWFVAFSSIAVAVQSWLLPEARSENGALLLLLVLVGAGVVSNVAMARLCERAASSIERDPALPKATVVSAQA